MATAPGYIFVGAGAFSTEAATSTQDGSNFVDMGGFRDDLRIRFSEERFNLEVADHLAFIKTVRTRIDCSVNTSLVEAKFIPFGVAFGTNPASLTDASSGYAPIAGQVELLVQDISSNYHNKGVAQQFVGADATDPASAELITWTFSQAVPIVDMELSYRKDGELLIPAAFMVLGASDGAGNYGFGNVS